MEQFWKSWDKSSRNIYLFSLVLFVATLLFAIFFAFQGHDNLIKWKPLDQYESIKVAIDSFDLGIFTIPVEADAKIVFSLLTGTAPEINLVAVWVFFIVVNIALLLALTSFTFLNNWLFYAGSFVVLLSYVFQQPDLLFSASDLRKFILMIPIVFLGGISYYFFAYSNAKSFTNRFLIIAAVAVLYFSGIFYFAHNQLSILYLTNYGTMAFVIIAIGFIFLVSFEILYFFLFVISNTKGAGTRNGTLQFVLVYVLYSLNLLMQYLKNRGVIQFDLVFINPFIILLFSSIVGIWGFKERSEMFKNTLPFSPTGAIIYISWAIIAAATVGYCYFSANDPVIEVFEDTILFTHIGFGFGFFLYVAWNYYEWINKQAQVHKMIYSFRWVTFLIVYAIGSVVVLAFFYYSNMFIYRQFQAGYHNFLGDIYYRESDLPVAERYYKDAEGWEFQNHKTNYALATIYQRQNRLPEALNFYRRANLKQPSAYAFANLAVMKYLQGRELESILDIKDGIAAFPNDGALKINLGLFYERIHFPDSSFYYFKNAEKDISMQQFASSNQKALFAKYKIVPKDEDESVSVENKSNQFITNELAHTFIVGKPIEKVSLRSLLKDTIVDEQTFALVNNFILKTKAEYADSSSMGTLNEMIASDTNIVFKTDLLYIKAIADNYRNKPYEAAKAVDLLQLSNEYSAGKYLNTMGLWALEQRNFRFASNIFQLAIDKGFEDATLNKAIAQAELHNFVDMIGTLQGLQNSTDTSVKIIVEKLFAIAKPLTYSQLVISEDEVKAAFLHYQGNKLSDSEKQNLFYGIYDKNAKLKAGVALFDYYYQKKNIEICGEILTELTKESYPSTTLSVLNLRLLQYLALKNNAVELAKATASHKLIGKELIYLPYFQAIAAENARDNIAAAEKHTVAFTNCAFNEEVVLQAAGFFANKMNDQKKAFNILLDGVAMNPYSVPLWEAYCLQSVAYGLPKFGENGLESLKPLVQPVEYQLFKGKFERAVEEYSKALFGF
ncbi:MAG: tetratricopeptide repeat protein [Cytophagales bacterium]